jgi:hypothetical protein
MGDGGEVLVEMGSGVGVMKDEKCAGYDFLEFLMWL